MNTKETYEAALNTYAARFNREIAQYKAQCAMHSSIRGKWALFLMHAARFAQRNRDITTVVMRWRARRIVLQAIARRRALKVSTPPTRRLMDFAECAPGPGLKVYGP